MSTSSQIASHLLRSRIGKVCVAIIGGTVAEMTETAAEVLKETNFLEFRLDYLPDPRAALPLLRDFLADRGAATAIATCRCKENGGRFAGSNAEALDLLLEASASGFHLVDIELESIETLPAGSLDRLRAGGSGVIVSKHDFDGTRDLDAIFRRIEPFAPDFIKVVPTARSLADNVTLMRFLSQMQEKGHDNIVGICMGEPGIISRVLGLRAGSAFTFAAAHRGEETAAGQIAARTLIETYRVDQVDAGTKVYGVAGTPISSSLSPLMMNTAFRRETVNAVYLALQTAKVKDLFELAREVPIQGLSVTMPLKQDVLPLLARTDALSSKIGSVNTVMRMADGKFYGFNTDVAGIVGPLERRLSLKGAKVLVLGAGGAARAAVFGCRDKGAEVSILNRTVETAQKLARQAGAKTIKREAVAKAGFDVIINATPVGMTGNGAAPLLGPDDLNARIVFDLVYNPLDTPLLQMARSKGLTAISGVEMFVQQGARQFEIWTGKPAPEEEMLRVVLHALRSSSGSVGPAALAADKQPLPSGSPTPSADVPPSHKPAAPATVESVPTAGAGQASASPKTPVAAKSAPAATPKPEAPPARQAAKGAGSPAPIIAPKAAGQKSVPKSQTAASKKSPSKTAAPAQRSAAPAASKAKQKVAPRSR